MLNALTVDVEDYFQVTAFERHVSRRDWDSFPSRVVDSTRRLLHLLAAEQVQATFFVLGWVANRFPDLVREIHSAGHEIGSHSYWHRLAYHLTPEAFRADLVESRDVLQDIIGESVTAFRAPSFSITRRSLWALEILASEGFTTDSSIFPIRHDRYGIPNASPRVHVLSTPAGSLREFPPSVVRFGRWNIPVSESAHHRRKAAAAHPAIPVRKALGCTAEPALGGLRITTCVARSQRHPRAAAGCFCRLCGRCRGIRFASGRPTDRCPTEIRFCNRGACHPRERSAPTRNELPAR
jgi:polysaccharide deacetylase family protein (PEP-CTERM system associated)